MKRHQLVLFLLALGLLFGAGTAIADDRAENVDADAIGTHTITREAPAETKTDHVEVFSHEWFDGPFSQGRDSCSGSCNASICVCSGSLSCCAAGCSACFDIVDSMSEE
ncbi:MAG: hypothetical protein AAGN66_16335 [Acidobacteriota bacterium]